jgi:hypothetical protein
VSSVATSRRGDTVAVASGAALLVVLFLPWYGVDLNVAGATVASGHATAWQAFGFIDLLLFLVAVVAIAVPLGRAAGSLPGGSRLVLAAGAVGLLLVLFRVVDLPATDIQTVGGDSIDVSRRIGLFLGLLATAGVACGGYRAISTE